MNGQYNFPASIRSFSVILCFFSFSVNSFRYGTISQDLLNLLQFLLRKLQILDRLHIIKHLLRSRCSHQHACHDPVTQHPAQSHLRKRLSPACGNAVQAPDLLQPFFCQSPFLEETSVSTDPAVLRDPVQIPVGQKSLRQRTECNDPLFQLRRRTFKSILFDSPIENGISVLINDKRTVHFIQDFLRPSQRGTVVVGEAHIKRLA